MLHWFRRRSSNERLSPSYRIHPHPSHLLLLSSSFSLFFLFLSFPSFLFLLYSSLSLSLSFIFFSFFSFLLFFFIFVESFLPRSFDFPFFSFYLSINLYCRSLPALTTPPDILPSFLHPSLPTLDHSTLYWIQTIRCDSPVGSELPLCVQCSSIHLFPRLISHRLLPQFLLQLQQ